MLPILRTSFPSFPVNGAAFNRLDSLFDQFLGTEGEGPSASRTSSWMPLSVWQDDGNFYVEAEVPGVAEKDVDLTVEKGVLTLKAERRDEEGRAYLYKGRGFGRFERSVTLPESVDSEHVEATLTNGVLRVVLPKHPSARPKKITLKGS